MRPAAAQLFSALLLACALVGPGAAQPDQVRIHSSPYHPPLPTIAIETNLVELGVTVRDSKGIPAGGFQASDFAVFDNRQQRNITFFSELRTAQPASAGATAPNKAPSSAAQPATLTAAQPRYIALFFDDTHAAMAGFGRSKRAAEKLIADGLQPGDRMGIYTGSGTVELDFTADAAALSATLAKMRRHPEIGATGFGSCPKLSAYQAYMITAHLDPMAKAIAVGEVMACMPGIPYDVAETIAQDAAESAWEQLRHQSSNVLSTLLLIARHLATEPGGRILLMVSPGFVTGEMDRQSSALVDACLRDRIVVNALDDEGLLASGLESPESLGARVGPRANWADKTLGLRTQIVTTFLSEAAASTGGQFIHNSNDLTGGLLALAAAPQVSYLLGFSPADKPDGKYHKLKVTTNKPGYEVSARPGYHSSLASERSETAQQRIDRLVASGDSLDQVPATVKLTAIAGQDGRYRVQVGITLDAKRLPFGSRSGKSLQQLTFVTVLEDAAGNYMEGKQALMDMVLTGAKRADLEAHGIKAVTSFLVPKGSYRIREVIREAVHNRMTASNSPLEIR